MNGVEGAAAYLNSTAGGSGIGGRKLVVDFYDSKLNADAARNATIQACDNDLALVGGGMLLLSNVDDITNCTDLAGQTTGLPDIPSLVSSAETCAPLTYPAIGYQNVCSPTTHQIVSWISYRGEGKWLLAHQPAWPHDRLERHEGLHPRGNRRCARVPESRHQGRSGNRRSHVCARGSKARSPEWFSA